MKISYEKYESYGKEQTNRIRYKMRNPELNKCEKIGQM